MGLVAFCHVKAVVVRRLVFRSVLLRQLRYGKSRYVLVLSVLVCQSRRGLSRCCKLSYGLLGQLWCYTTKIIIS